MTLDQQLAADQQAGADQDYATVCTLIAQQVFRYARGIDRMDAELMMSVFKEDAHIYYGAKFEGTPAGFVEWLWPLHADMIGHQHLISNVLVEHARR